MVRDQNMGLGSSAVFFFEGSGIRLCHFCGIMDQHLSGLKNQGSEIWVQKWDQRWKNIPGNDPGTVNRTEHIMNTGEVVL